MPLRGAMRVAGRFLPLALAVVTIGIIGVCIALTALDPNAETGGLPLAYVSDTGSTPPRLYIFAIGLTLAGGAQGLTAVLVWLSFNERESWNKHAKNCVTASVPFGLVSGVCMALLAILDTRNFPDAHLYAAIAFFALTAIYITLLTVAYTLYWRQDERDSCVVKTSAILKLVLCVLFWIAFLIYLPIGYPLLGDECWVYNMASRTWDYRACIGGHLLRVGSQYACIALIATFLATLSLDLFRGKLVGDGHYSTQLDA